MLVFASSVLLLSRCVGDRHEDIRGQAFAGSESCRNCHKSIYESYLNSAHRLTSRPANAQTILGSFEKGQNEFEYNPALKVVMEKEGDKFFQASYVDGKRVEAHSFDVSVGSGRKAQTYLFFDDTKIFQLPVSYFVPAHSWANSPNFPADHVKFDRSIPSGCFGCHSTAVDVTQSYTGFQLNEAFNTASIMYGIDCERCHGPAAEHVSYHQDHPSEKSPKFITVIRGLHRQQRVDMCAVCHSGFKESQQPIFNFRPGDSLEHYYYPEFSHPSADKLDVHGNQAQLMEASKCFLKSADLSCMSCHDVHKQERTDMQLFSNRCIDCHKNTEHSYVKNGELTEAVLKQNCIDCHMPLKPSANITLLTKSTSPVMPDMIRTHLIAIYPAESKQFVEALKKIKN